MVINSECWVLLIDLIKSQGEKFFAVQADATQYLFFLSVHIYRLAYIKINKYKSSFNERVFNGPFERIKIDNYLIQGSKLHHSTNEHDSLKCQ